MRLPLAGREWYVQKITTTPPVTGWEASFDGGSVWIPGTVDPDDSTLVRWLVKGPDFDGDAEPAVTVTADVTPVLRLVDHPETLIRQGTRIYLGMLGGDEEPLFTAEDMAGMPGAPFSASTATAAGDQIRTLCGWHIAPSRTETLTLDTEGGRVLVLPSLRVSEVLAVRDVSGPTPKVLTGWRWSKDGMLERGNGGFWPDGFRVVEVDLTHGYESCPSELLNIGAEFSRRRVAQESIGGRSVTYVSSADDDDRIGSVLGSYRIGALP